MVPDGQYAEAEGRRSYEKMARNTKGVDARDQVVGSASWQKNYPYRVCNGLIWRNIMIKLTRIIEEIRVIGEPAPTHGIWVNEIDVVRIEEDPGQEKKTWVWAKDTPAFQVTETPEEVVAKIENSFGLPPVVYMADVGNLSNEEAKKYIKKFNEKNK